MLRWLACRTVGTACIISPALCLSRHALITRVRLGLVLPVSFLGRDQPGKPTLGAANIHVPCSSLAGCCISVFPEVWSRGPFAELRLWNLNMLLRETNLSQDFGGQLGHSKVIGAGESDCHQGAAWDLLYLPNSDLVCS